MIKASPKRVLIVDDDLDIRANLSDILRDAGYEVETAPDGSVAVEMVRGASNQPPIEFDLCLLDYRMPGMDGFSLMEHLRSMAPEMQFVLMTAFGHEERLERAAREGLWTMLAKPIDVPKLMGIVNQRHPASAS